MRKPLLLLLLFASQLAFAQRGLLYVKKHGYKKVATLTEGSYLRFQTRNHDIVQGYLALVKGDSLFVNGYFFRTSDIAMLYLSGKKEKTAGNQLLLISAGTALATAGMTLAKWTSFPKALAVSAGLGYGQFLIQTLPRLKRAKYRIGRKFTLQTLDLHI